MNHLIIILILFLINIVMLSVYSKELFQSVYLGQPTKCFSCEKELPENLKYLGGPSKCYSCENQLLKSNIIADLAQPTKCFSCER